MLESSRRFCLHTFQAVYWTRIPVTIHMRNRLYISLTSGCRRDADEIWALQVYNAASSGKGLPLDAALYPRRAQIAYTSISIPPKAPRPAKTIYNTVALEY
jgi:hypothetical protein